MASENVDADANSVASGHSTGVQACKLLEMTSQQISKQTGGQADPYLGWPTWPINFAGWAPTVSSRFTFSMLGDNRDRTSKTVNLQDSDHNRFIAHVQDRETKDAAKSSIARKRSKYTCFLAGVTHEAWHVRPSLLERIGLKRENGENGSHPPPEERETATGELQDLETVQVERGMLSGTVCYFLKSAGEAGATKKGAKKPDPQSLDRIKRHNELGDKLGNLITDLDQTPRVAGVASSISETDFVAKATEPIRDVIEQSAGQHGLTVCRFQFHRTGEVRIFVRKESFPDQVKVILFKEDVATLPEHLKVRTVPQEKPRSLEEQEFYLTVSNEELINPDAHLVIRENLKRMIEPMFDFIRDTFHRHYHHSQNDDRMVDIFRTNPQRDHSWRLETLQKLMSAVQHRRRKSDESNLRDAQGLLAYAEAFQIQLAGIKRREDNYNCFVENVKLKPHYLRFLERSMGVEFDKRVAERSARQHSHTIITTSVFATLATIAAAFLTFKPEGIEDPTLSQSLLTIAHEHLIATIFFVFGFTSFALYFSYDLVSAKITRRNDGEVQSSPFSRMMSGLSHRLETWMTVRLLSWRRNKGASMKLAKRLSAGILYLLGAVIGSLAILVLYITFSFLAGDVDEGATPDTTSVDDVTTSKVNSPATAETAEPQQAEGDADVAADDNTELSNSIDPATVADDVEMKSTSDDTDKVDVDSTGEPALEAETSEANEGTP